MKIFVATLLVLICPLAYARFLPEWSYEKLNSEADLIVIATPVKILETTEYEPYRFDIFDKPDPVKANVTKTDFSILTILQGKCDRIVVLRHHRVPNDLDPKSEDAKAFYYNGPKYLKFDPKANKSYLLFLKRLDRGEYVAVSGQVDPWISIKPLEGYPYPVKEAEQERADQPATPSCVESPVIVPPPTPRTKILPR